jgi:multicomponent Na+:H+ antiporter subunit D
MSETVLFGRGRELRFTAILWMMGGCALAGMPPFATFLGESLVSGAGEKVGYTWISGVFIVAGAFTGGAVFRVGMRIFAGWGDQGPSDRSSRVDELPETGAESKIIRWFLFTPAACCILGCLAVCFAPALREYLQIAAARFLDQDAYIRLVYTGAWSSHAAVAASPALLSSMLCGTGAALLAMLLALASVFHHSIPRVFRWPSHIEGPMRGIRALQSGHPGDYVTWLTVGVSVIGCSLYLLLR